MYWEKFLLSLSAEKHRGSDSELFSAENRDLPLIGPKSNMVPKYEICAPLQHCRGYGGNSLPPRRIIVWVPSSGVLKIGPTRCAETSVRKYHYSCFMSQKRADLIYFASEVWNQARCQKSPWLYFVSMCTLGHCLLYFAYETLNNA